MNDQILRWLNDVFTTKGFWRGLWLLMALSGAFGVFEAQTNYFEVGSISHRLEALGKASQQPLSAEQSTRIERIKTRLLDELETVEAKRAFQLGQFMNMVIRFLKGAWVAFPLFWLVIKLSVHVMKSAQENLKLQIRTWTLYLGWLALAMVARIATVLGLISVLWNSSPAFFASWIVFPLCSAGFAMAAGLWIWLVRGSPPKEMKQQPTAPTP
jgi:hypothetical protein